MVQKSVKQPLLTKTQFDPFPPGPSGDLGGRSNFPFLPDSCDRCLCRWQGLAQCHLLPGILNHDYQVAWTSLTRHGRSAYLSFTMLKIGTDEFDYFLYLGRYILCIYFHVWSSFLTKPNLPNKELQKLVCSSIKAVDANQPFLVSQTLLLLYSIIYVSSRHFSPSGSSRFS